MKLKSSSLARLGEEKFYNEKGEKRDGIKREEYNNHNSTKHVKQKTTQHATKERTEAPINEPIVVAPLLGPGAGAGTSAAAATALMEAAAKRTAQATFFISMAYYSNLRINVLGSRGFYSGGGCGTNEIQQIDLELLILDG
ncbi:hypothetical protein Lal_00034481 [Lupinus albus]|nr:hypothetical protein Lal_00034481 [Lupinus albus]